MSFSLKVPAKGLVVVMKDMHSGAAMSVTELGGRKTRSRNGRDKVVWAAATSFAEYRSFFNVPLTSNIARIGSLQRLELFAH